MLVGSARRRLAGRRSASSQNLAPGAPAAATRRPPRPRRSKSRRHQVPSARLSQEVVSGPRSIRAARLMPRFRARAPDRVKRPRSTLTGMTSTPAPLFGRPGLRRAAFHARGAAISTGSSLGRTPPSPPGAPRWSYPGTRPPHHVRERVAPAPRPPARRRRGPRRSTNRPCGVVCRWFAIPWSVLPGAMSRARAPELRTLPGRKCHAHSQRSATTGSTRVARRAGK